MNGSQIAAVARLLEWAKEANSRLPQWERDGATGFDFGGNPAANPVFKAVELLLFDLQDDREQIQEGDYRYYKPQE